jgi:hypothetical protein
MLDRDRLRRETTAIL